VTPETASPRRSWLRARDLRTALRFPRLWPKLAANTARAALGRRVLRGVEFAVTYRCDLDCPHCLKQRLVDGSRAELTAQEIRRTARRIAGLGGIFINLTGGEAALREDIEEIVAATSGVRGLIVTLASNGYALSEDLLRRLTRRGLAMLVLSLDGPTAEVHDAFRGRPGAFAGVVRSVEAARRLRLPAWLTAVATRENTRNGDLRRVAALADAWGCPLTLNLPYPVGGWNGRDVALSPEEYAEYRALLRLPHVRWEGSSNWLGEGCPAGVEKIYITPYGDVFPCAVIHTPYGNARDEPLDTIYARLGAHPCYGAGRKPCLVAEDPDRLARASAADGRTG
jgi:MoaA/NifB/PqqE/SkfB family radical SAM enzyme